MNHLEHPDSIDGIIKEVSAKDTHVLCREVMSITDTMDVLRAKWNVEILTAIICGQTRFKDILAVVKGISENVLSDRLRQLADDRLIDKKGMLWLSATGGVSADGTRQATLRNRLSDDGMGRGASKDYAWIKSPLTKR